MVRYVGVLNRRRLVPVEHRFRSLQCALASFTNSLQVCLLQNRYTMALERQRVCDKKYRNIDILHSSQLK